MVKDVYQHLYEFQLTRLMRGVTMGVIADSRL